MKNKLKPEIAEEKEGSSAEVEKSKGISAGTVDKYLRFVVFLAIIGMVYIWNAHKAEKQVRKLEALKKEIRDLKSEYTTMDADLSYGTKQSVVAELVDSIDLKPLRSSPYKLKKQ